MRERNREAERGIGIHGRGLRLWHKLLFCSNMRESSIDVKETVQYNNSIKMWLPVSNNSKHHTLTPWPQPIAAGKLTKTASQTPSYLLILGKYPVERLNSFPLAPVCSHYILVAFHCTATTADTFLISGNCSKIVLNYATEK